MIAEIGLLIALYVTTRMIETYTESSNNAVQILAVVTAFVAVLVFIDLLLRFFWPGNIAIPWGNL